MRCLRCRWERRSTFFSTLTPYHRHVSYRDLHMDRDTVGKHCVSGGDSRWKGPQMRPRTRSGSRRALTLFGVLIVLPPVEAAVQPPASSAQISEIPDNFVAPEAQNDYIK